MRLNYKYIHFVRAIKQNPKTWIYYVRANPHSKGAYDFLGTIKWFPHWRQYGFYPEQGTVFEKTCLKDITEVCIELNERQSLRNKKVK